MRVDLCEPWKEVSFTLPDIDTLTSYINNESWVKERIDPFCVRIHDKLDDLTGISSHLVPAERLGLLTDDFSIEVTEGLALKLLRNELAAFINDLIYPSLCNWKGYPNHKLFKSINDRYGYLYESYHAKKMNRILSKHSIPKGDGRWKVDPMPEKDIFYGVHPNYDFKIAKSTCPDYPSVKFDSVFISFSVGILCEERSSENS